MLADLRVKPLYWYPETGNTKSRSLSIEMDPESPYFPHSISHYGEDQTKLFPRYPALLASLYSGEHL